MSFLRSRHVVTFFIAFILYIIHISVIGVLIHGVGLTTEIIPFFEELSKYIGLSISGLCGVYWVSIFGIEEALSFIFKYHSKVGWSQIIVIRFVALVFHFVLLWLQYYGFKTYRKTGKFRYTIIYFTMAVGFHYLWNMGGGILILYHVIEPALNWFSISLVGG
jgi:hypothetical protein